MAVRVRRRSLPTPAQEPADERCDYIPVPPVGFDDEGYPVEDSVSQSEQHWVRTSDWGITLREWCRRRGRGEAFSDLTMPYRQGQKNKVLVPDLMVALRAERRGDRLSYKLWQEPTPEFVLEALSNSTWRGDVGAKKRLYRSLGVREYWLFDPDGRRLGEQLRGYRLVRVATTAGPRQIYQRVPKNRSGRRPSEVLGLEISVVDDDLRFYDPEVGRNLTTVRESLVRAGDADAEENRANRERAAREAAERRIAELEAQLRALRQSEA